MYAAYPGDVVFSKIDARNGAIGVLPEEIATAVVTTEFPVFIPASDRLDGEFLKLVLRTSDFLAALRARASGTSGRKRITPEVFSDLRIPLPPPPEQRAIVAAHRDALDRAASLEREADETEARGIRTFEAALGFEPTAEMPERPIFTASFKDLDRWGHEAVHRRIGIGRSGTSRYPVVPLGNEIADLAVGWSPKCLGRPARKDEWGVLKLSAVTSGYLKPLENKALPPSVEPRPQLELKRGDVLVTRGSGVKRLVGAAIFVANEPPRRLMVCDLIFRVVFQEGSRIDPAFLAAILATTDLRAQIEERRTGAAPMMQKITKSALMSLRIPLPLKNGQADMVAPLTEARSKAADLRKQAAKARAEAWTDFEAALYSVGGRATKPANS